MTAETPSPPQGETSARRAWPRLVFWLIMVGIVIGLWSWYHAEVRRNRIADQPPRNSPPPKAEAAIVLRIEGGVQPLSLGELAVINGSAELWKLKQGKSPVAVIAPNRTRALLAKVILHSLGVASGAVEIDQAVKRGGQLGKLKPPPEETPPKHVAVILGNEPLDGSTPTLDMVRRALSAARFHQDNPDAILIFTGGPTAGGLSEAWMMAAIAASRGVPQENMRMEEAATSTRLNAKLTAKLLAGTKPEKLVIISKASHLKAAMPMFKKHAIFKNAEPLASEITQAEIIADMEAYLKAFNSPRVRARLKAVKAGVGGVD